jgi:hypothetical protein
MTNHEHKDIEADTPTWYLTICKACGLVWISDDQDGQDCPAGTPDNKGFYHLVFAFELDDSDEGRTIEDVVDRNLPYNVEGWEGLVVALRDPDVYWSWPVKDMPRHTALAALGGQGQEVE